jgi:hypothetical protein
MEGGGGQSWFQGTIGDYSRRACNFIATATLSHKTTRLTVPYLRGILQPVREEHLGKKMPITKVLAAATAVVILSSFQAPAAFAQSGDTQSGDAKEERCHTNPKSGYHCHGKSEEPDRVTYCHVVNGQDSCGYVFDACAVLVTQYGGTCKQQ